jgi:hypothetical protein
VFVSNVKSQQYDDSVVHESTEFLTRVDGLQPMSSLEVESLLDKSFSPRALGLLLAIKHDLKRISDGKNRNFLLLALLSTVSLLSRGRHDGGWIRWAPAKSKWTSVVPTFRSQVERMLADLKEGNTRTTAAAYRADARALPSPRSPYDALVCSPPYPNRHDYSRIFSIELLFAFLEDSGIKELRRASLRSHVEATAPSFNFEDYCEPPGLTAAISRVAERAKDARVPRMLRGYFEDMHLVLRSGKSVLKKGAPMAFVLGNVRYNGITIPVDSITADIAIAAGLRVEHIYVARLRGNSAQQMGIFGRCASRESVLILRN